MIIHSNDTNEQDAIYRHCGVPEEISIPETIDMGRPKTFTPQTLKTYSFTTEHIAGYVDELNLEGKIVACITGSGDFPINAYLYGADCVDAVDISPVACCYGELKCAGLQNLDYEEFLGFFGTQDWRSFGSSSLSYDTYCKLRPKISNTARSLFDKLITPKGRHPFLEPGGIILMNTSKMYKIKRQNPYLSGSYRFNEAKSRFKPVLFWPQEMTRFLNEHTAKYDVIHLSNIHDYGIDPERLIISASHSLRNGGQIIIIHFTRAISVDFNDCSEYIGFHREYGLRARFKVTTDPVGTASICARIFLIPERQE